MTRLQHLITILIEECNETAQRATKALRFGTKEVQPGQELNNAERIAYEFNDIVALMEMLRDEGVFEEFNSTIAVGLKKEKVEKYLAYSKQIGELTDDKVM